MELSDLNLGKPDKKRTSNVHLIRAAFNAGFKSGVSFLNESESDNDFYWRNQDWKEFVAKHKIKV